MLRALSYPTGCRSSLRLRGLFACLAVALSVGSASAERPDARQMSCAQAQALVTSSGAVVLTVRNNIFERYVATANFCARNEILKRRWIVTGDGISCNVGFVCRLPLRRPSR